MGNIYSSFNMTHFEEIMNHKGLLINTLDVNDQKCLIINTIPIHEEETIINNYLKTNKFIHIVIYGMNYRDKTIIKKYNQLQKLGFSKVSIYFGGLFEWLCLQEIYGIDNFKTNGKVNDLLKYK